MADVYSYALLVELEENNVPRLKNKLVKYFQSKKSNGGDCEVEYDTGSRTAVLHFRREEDQKNVLGKETHQISLDKGVLKMTVRLLTDETTTQEGIHEAPPNKLSKKSDVAVDNKQSTADERTPAAKVQTEAKGGDHETAVEELSSASAVLGNVSETLSQEFLEMLVENILKASESPSASQSFTVEVVPYISSAVVTFQNEKERTDFMTACSKHRTFTKKGLSVEPLESTEQVLVEDLRNFGEDLLRLYFENAGGDVEDVVLNEEEQSAIITFKDHEAVQKIMKKKHCIKQEEIRVYPFYKSLGTALYGKDKPPLKLPAAISQPIDDALWRYLKDNQSAAKTIQSHLEKLFCNVNLSQSTVRLIPVSSLLQQKDAKAIIKEWGDRVKSAFAQALSNFKPLKLQPESEVWEESEVAIRERLVNEDVVLVSDKASGVLSVAGPVADISRVEQALYEVMNKILRRVQREKSSVTQEIKVSPSIFHILCQNGLRDKLLSVYPELKMSFSKDSPDLRVTGLSHEVMAVSKVIYDEMFALKRQNIEIDNFVLDMLKDEQQEELTNALLTSNGINAAFDISAYRVQLLAVSDRDLSDAEDHLVQLLISQYIAVEDSNVLKMPEWNHLVSQLKTENDRPCRRIQINIAGPQVVVSGHKDSVITVRSKLDEFLTQNAQVEEDVVVKPNAIVEYIRKCDSTCLEHVNNKVVVSFRKEAICLSGSRVDVAECKTLVDTVISSVIFESLKVTVPGVKKSFQSKKAMYVNSIFNETGCVVQLVDETSDGQDDFAQRPVPKPVYQLQTSDGVEIAVCKADMCSYPVHAVVNASNQDLQHNGGLAGALLNAAGPQLQDECNKIISSKGQLNPGDCVITGAGGQLCCKKVIHAVGPRFDQAKPQKAQAQLKRAVKGSLELAETHGCVSVALPAISRSLGFPPDLCASTIVKAVKEYCDDKYDDNTIKKIHFVNNDDGAVQAMEAAVRTVFGNNGVSHAPQTLPTKAAKPSPVKHAGPDPNCLGQVQTKEGLGVTLTKGNIEEATTEVTVNTVFEDLALNKGAVSTAILRVAGPKLQQLASEQGENANVGDVIVTDGCKLKSKHVFHVVTPHWDNGQGTAQKILSGIFKDCLNKAETGGLTSISFPAIGTGNLGFPKDLAASLILDEILAFSSKKQPKHLKKVVIILYPGDAPTIQVFSDEFKKRFPNTSVPTPSPQSSGPFSKVVSSSGMYETKMGSVAVQVLTGDITKETTDVIVNSSNDSFSLKSGVSKAILDAAGQAVEAECQTLGAQPHPGMIMTQPGNLKCKKILHLVGQTDVTKINKSVKEALQMCVKNSHTSVSFPAIGTGQGNVQARQVADAMLDAVIDVLSQNTSSTLKTVRIVIFQPPMIKEFHSSMQHREASDPKDKSDKSWGSTMFKNIKAFFIGSTEKPKKEEDFVIAAVKVEPACFHICGDAQAKVDQAKKWINDLVSSEQDNYTISDPAILSLSNADRQRIVDIQRTRGVSISIDTKKPVPSLTIEGLSTDVLKASREINEMVRKTRDEEELNRKVDLAGRMAEWQYQQQGSQFKSFDPMTNYELEEALEKNLPRIKVTIQGQDCTVLMPNGPATDSQGRTLEIKRIDKVKGDDELPANWETMPANCTSHAVVIQAGTQEYTDVEKLFKASCARTIVQIERIQNPTLWKGLEIKKLEMDVRNGHQNNERRLFHGTSEDTVAHINENGFNRSYAGKNATAYGKGTYFAVNANYSAHDTYSRPNQKGEKFMYLCRVLTGDFTVGNQNTVVPPAKGTASVHKYDSVVDNVAKPSLFVTFHDSQACPEYLITFK